MNCKKCGNQVDKKAVVCTNCGCKLKQPLYKKWWFWLIVCIILTISLVDSGETESSNISANNSQTSTVSTTAAKEYEKIEIQTMIDDLYSNALKAEKTYQGKYVEIRGKITSFDSNGSYISIEAINADYLNFDTILCNVKDEAQLNLLLERSVGDIVTIKGKVTSVSDIFGYTVKIEEFA